eukprot:m.18841 g.18841  ORF g.18841 m.18841 type:complete len:103 (+) comp7953_c1_seq1:252-560(+)
MADRGDTHPDRYKVGEETIDERMKALHIAVDPADVTQSCATFVIGNESHTLGNALKWMLNKEYGIHNRLGLFHVPCLCYECSTASNAEPRIIFRVCAYYCVH